MGWAKHRNLEHDFVRAAMTVFWSRVPSSLTRRFRLPTCRGGESMYARPRFALGFVLFSFVLLAVLARDRATAQAKPEGEMRWALYVTLPPVWFDPGEVSGQLTPFWVLYALHDA